MEDDEYKNASEEHTYYSIAHTIHESVTEQASILVNGNLKEYQIKVMLINDHIKQNVKSYSFNLRVWNG